MPTRPTYGELIVATADTPLGTYEQFDDGDIVVAISGLKMRSVAAQHLTHWRNASRNSDGYMALTDVIRDRYEATRQFRFERVSRFVVNKFDIATDTLVEEVTNPHTDMWIDGLKQRVFGTAGSEVWYGGNRTITHDTMDAVWTAIEAKTANVEGEHRWNWSDEYLSKYLVMKVDDFDAATAIQFNHTPVDENGNVVAKRGYTADWRTAYPLRVTDILDRNLKFDRRGQDAFSRADLISRKGGR